MKIALPLLIIIYFLYLTTFSRATDSNPLQDFCVAVDESTPPVFVNGKICKNPNMVDANDFYYSGLNIPGNTSNPSGFKATPVTVDQLGGLNTLSISVIRLDFAPYGLDSPHTHPRATEILVLLEGTLYAGFVTSTNSSEPIQENKLFTKTLYAGDVFVFPQGLIHFLLNVGKTNAVALVSQNSQNPGVVRISNTVLASSPLIRPDILAKGFQVNETQIREAQADFQPDNI